VRAARSLLPLLLVSVGCTRSFGFSVTVTNECQSAVAFDLDGGRPRPDSEPIPSELLPGESRTYSVIAGEDGAYLLLIEPVGELLLIAAPVGEDPAEVVLNGDPCIATIR
jgi:hypothetical protein